MRTPRCRPKADTPVTMRTLTVAQGRYLSGNHEKPSPSPTEQTRKTWNYLFLVQRPLEKHTIAQTKSVKKLECLGSVMARNPPFHASSGTHF